MKHTAFAFGFASLVAACAAQPRHPLCIAGAPACSSVGQAGRPVEPPPAPPRASTSQVVLGGSAEIAMRVDDVRTWSAPAMTAVTPRTDDDVVVDRSARARRERRRAHARLHDAAVRAGLATLLAPAPGQHAAAVYRPLLGRELRALSGNVMTKRSKGKGGDSSWSDGSDDE